MDDYTYINKLNEYWKDTDNSLTSAYDALGLTILHTKSCADYYYDNPKYPRTLDQKCHDIFEGTYAELLVTIAANRCDLKINANARLFTTTPDNGTDTSIFLDKYALKLTHFQLKSTYGDNTITFTISLKNQHSLEKFFNNYMHDGKVLICNYARSKFYELTYTDFLNAKTSKYDRSSKYVFYDNLKPYSLFNDVLTPDEFKLAYCNPWLHAYDNALSHKGL